MDLFKIAKKILADYIYDPKHLKAVPSHYHKTKRGWSDNKGVKTKSFYKENIGSLAPYAMSFVEPYLNKQDETALSASFSADFKKSQNISQLLQHIVQNKNARQWMMAKVKAKMNNKSSRVLMRVDNLIQNYVKVCKNEKLAGSFSRLIGLSMGNGGEDWRMQKYGFQEPSNEMVKNARLYQKSEQELILHTGLVNKTGYLHIYRKTTKPPVDGVYKGGFVESWSLSPSIETKSQNKTYLISTSIPVSKVIASSVGRGDNWIHSNEREVLVESSYLTNVRVVSTENIPIESETLFNETRENYKNINQIVESANQRSFVESLKLENLSDIENPTNEDLMNLRKMSPEYREMSQTELITLFKTLTKEGFFDKKEK